MQNGYKLLKIRRVIMPRRARLDVPGALHHIMVRGINKCAIFKNDQDKNAFLERLGKNVTKGECTIYAWVLMNNHAHILFKSGMHGISTVMRKQLTWYAQYFNHRYHRTGHLFENRFKSILCEEQNYLLALVRYIHLNPLRAKIIGSLEELERFPRSGHKAIIGKAKYPWMAIDTILGQFGGMKKVAIEAYRQFVNDGQHGENGDPNLGGGGLVRSQGGWSEIVAMRRKGISEQGDERILGGGEFVQAILKETEERHLRQLRIHRSGKRLIDLIREECGKKDISHHELNMGCRRREVSETRIAIAKRGRKELGLTGAEMAQYLGVNTSSINRALAKNNNKIAVKSGTRNAS